MADFLIDRLRSGGLISNYFCTSSCKHCLYYCSPQLDKLFIDSDKVEKVRRKLLGFEGKFTEAYRKQVFGLFHEWLRPIKRRGFKAYDGLNNIFNLAYELLSWKVHRALIKARLEPFLGFLHSVQLERQTIETLINKEDEGGQKKQSETKKVIGPQKNIRGWANFFNKLIKAKKHIIFYDCVELNSDIIHLFELDWNRLVYTSLLFH